MEEKKEVKKELCAITKEFAGKQLEIIVSDPAKKAILDEYFTWINVLNSPVNIVTDPVADENPADEAPLKKVE